MAFTLQYLSTTKTLAEWGADDSSVLQLQNQSEGRLTLHFPGMMDADVPFAYKGKIVLRKDTTVIFRGHAMAPRRTGEGSSEGITIDFVDAWWFLANGTITQTIYDGAGTPAAREGVVTFGTYNILTDTTGLVVGMKLTCDGALSGVAEILSVGTGSITVDKIGLVSVASTLVFQAGATASSLYALFANIRIGNGWEPMTVEGTLTAILTACDTHHGGGVIQFGACHGAGFGISPQPVDVKGTFANAVQAALAFVPDAVPRMDYSSDPPALSFYQRNAADEQTLAFADERVMISQEIEARPDLLISGVRILYQYYLTDGSPATAVDQAGDESGPGVVQVEFEMRPPSQQPTQVPAVTETQYLRSEPILKDSKEWWFRNAELEIGSADDILFFGGTGPVLELDPDAPENEGLTEEELTDLHGCTKRIIEGNIPAWLNDEAHLRYVRVRGFLTLNILNDLDDPSKGKKKVQRRIALTFAATDLGTNDYENIISAAHTEGGTFDPEAPPSGIAAAILAAGNTLQYQGSVTLTDEDCDFSFAPGQVLNVTGSSRAEWETMNAQIQSVSWQLQTGVTGVSFGPAESLAPQDWLEMSRRMMRMKPALQLESRGSGNTESSGSGKVNHPRTQVRFGIKQTDNVETQKDVVSAGSVEKTVESGKEVWSDGTTTITVDASGKVISVVGGGKSAIIDLDDLPAGGVAKFRSLTVCVGGAQKTASVLMTEPV